MLFGLNNVGATYQQLVNKMFAEYLGNTMEVYIDDILVRSPWAVNHIFHLKQGFSVFNSYKMKLNLKKCTFGVLSR